MGTATETILELRKINKAFPGVKALTDVELMLKKGEVLALVGENGAGKSTLMKILSGAYKKDSGSIIFDGKEVEIQSPIHSEELGIAIIYQELNLIQRITVAENVYLGRYPEHNGVIQWKQMYEDSQKLINELGINIDVHKMLREMSLAEQQLIEIVKAVSTNAKVVIMDEPTSSLSQSETELLFDIIRKLKEKGTSIIFITHRLDEIYAVCDRMTILRDGCYIGSRDVKDVTKNEMIEMMIGRKLTNQYPSRESVIGETVLEVKNISDGGKRVKNVSFQAHSGEVLGFAGLVGAGRSETLKAVFGADKKAKGEIYMKGQRVNIRSPKDAIRYGIGFLPEERKKEGLVTDLAIVDNVLMVKPENAMHHGLFSMKKAEEICQKYIEELLIKTPSDQQKAKFLSGGNQQKVVVAKWLNCEPEIIILDEPTRGIDVNAKREIYNIIVKLAEQGKSIILISSEMSEIIGLCDRVNIMSEGRISGELSREELSQERIMKFATGGC